MEKIRAKLLALSLGIWNYVFMGLILLLIGLILGSLLSKSWIIAQTWTGGILRINSGALSGTHYSDLSCTESCLFPDLEKGGIVCIVFDLLSLILLLSWLAGVVYNTRGMRLLISWIKYAILIGSVIAHWIAIISWGAITKLTFNGNNEYSSTGPALGVSAAVISPIVAALYLIIFNEVETKELPNMESIRVEGRHKWTEPKSFEEAENRN